jgi:adenylate kinase family enzyme
VRDPADLASANAVVILGVSGSGKTTLAKRLAEALNVPYVDMNALLDGPADDLVARFDNTSETGGWVADASLQKHLGDHVLERAGTIVWLDLPLRIALLRQWRRSLRDRESPVGQSWGAIRAHLSNRRRFPRRLARFERVVRLRSPLDVKAWSP